MYLLLIFIILENFQIIYLFNNKLNGDIDVFIMTFKNEFNSFLNVYVESFHI